MNEQELKALISRAADGEAEAQYRLAMKYIYGDGVEENNDVAAGLLERSARQGHVEATYNLAICHHYGYGVREDLKTAFTLYERAAERGYGKAIVMAGRFYLEGTHGEKDHGNAMEYFHKALDSDDMEAVCYDMYIKLLNEAIGEEKGEQKKVEEECSVDLDISANIPESYIPSLSHRLSIYRRIADIKTIDDKMDVIDELCDRFGEPPSEVLGLMDVALLKGAAGRNGIYEISGDKSEINFYLKRFEPETAGELIKKLGQGTLLVPTEPVHFTIKLKPGQSTINLLRELSTRL